MTKFAIPNPCHRSWVELSGDGRKRYCGECQTYVHAIEQYSAEEWDQVWRESEGHVCGLLCGESAPEPRSRRAVLVGALLTEISPLMAQTGRVRIRVVDTSTARVPGAEVSLLNADGKPARAVRTDVAGEIVWADLRSARVNSRFSCPASRRSP